jgi:two-component system, OmpR family, osmolarity sensor histidine kinase EnvZ
VARRSAGLLGRILFIVLLAVGIEFAASTFLYERAETARMQEGEAHRIAEHVAVAYHFLSSRPPAERPAWAARLSSDGVHIRWLPGDHVPPVIAPSLDQLRGQMVSWEPVLARANLRLYFHSPGRDGAVKGTARLADGSTLAFRTPAIPQSLSFTFNRILLALVPAIALVVIAALLVRRTLLPMNQLAEAAEDIGRGQTRILSPRGPGEVRRVMRAFNGMQQRIHRLIADRTQALAAVGHDLRTPIARLHLRAEGIADPALRQAIASDLGEMEHMLESLLSYLGGEDDPEPRVRIDLAVLMATLADEAQDAGHEAGYAGPDHAEVSVRPVAFKRALSNLIENALKYGGSAQVALVEQPDALVVSVEDGGPGIAEDRLDEALEPFVRIDPARSRDTSGLGLGLSIVKRVVEQEGGTLTLSNRPTGGLRAEIRLPR